MGVLPNDWHIQHKYRHTEKEGAPEPETVPTAEAPPSGRPQVLNDGRAWRPQGVPRAGLQPLCGSDSHFLCGKGTDSTPSGGYGGGGEADRAGLEVLN